MCRKSANKSLGGAVRLCLLSAGLSVVLVATSSATRRDSTGAGDLVDRIGWSLARPGDYPFHVGVYVRDKYVCGAALLDHRRILTSSRCVTRRTSGRLPLEPDNVTVKVGAHLILRLADGESTLRLDRIKVDQRSRLALLFANQSIGMNSIVGKGAIRAITLPANQSSPAPNSSLFTGAQRRGPCKGDEGGPLFQATNSGGFTLVGIFQGSSCNACNDPACDNQFTNISRALQWINGTK